IGLMRSGRLLAEESPQVLLATYGCNSLEEVFLKLSRKQASETELDAANLANNRDEASLHWSHKEDTVNVSEESGVIGLNFHQSKEVLISDSTNGLNQMNGGRPAKEMKSVKSACIDCMHITTPGKMRALLQKNFLRMWRNVGVMLFIFALPVMQVILFCLAIGRDPTDLRIAVVNHELNSTDVPCPIKKGCHLTFLSCRYLSHLPAGTLEQGNCTEEAINSVKDGNAWGVLYFTENFTDALVARMSLGKDSDEETLDQSEVRVWLDMSNQQIGLMVQRDLQKSYRNFIQDLLISCNENPKVADIPIQFKTPIYGSTDPSFTDFVAPGVILTIVFFLAVALTSSALIIERMEGLLDRSWVAGVTPSEILFSHVITQFVVMCGQTALVLIFMIIVFGVECKGDLFSAVILTILQGLCGMCFGFVISAICELERNAIQLALGSVIWPIEGMPCVLRYISLGLPLTMATSALRSILSRGWSIVEPDVYYGYISTLIWIFLFLTISLVVLRFKKDKTA
ncbi:hypothetical protein L9F63_016018, partial [Diploptera punctata]